MTAQLSMIATSTGRYLEASAVISPCETYRYELRRVWDRALPLLVFVMINPSTADATQDDATIRKCVGFAQRLGFGSILVVNLFAYRATKISDLVAASRVGVDVVGPLNDASIEAAAVSGSMVIAAWGPKEIIYRDERMGTVLRILRRHRDVHALKMSSGIVGEPCHPLMLPYALQPVLCWGRSAT